MRWSFGIGRIWGTELKIHGTFLLLLAWYAFDAYRSGGVASAVVTTAFVLGIFACVILHEFGHARMAAHFGIRTPDITLLPFGGLARLERMPEEPRQEVLIALAGPAVTFVLAIIGYAALHLLPAAREREGLAELVFSNLYRVNLFLLLFNLIPAFPMDGGRVLRALLVRRNGYVQATHYAAQVGRVIAVGFAVIGIVGWKPWFEPGDWILILIALFVWSSGTSEARAVAFRTAATTLTAGQVMLHPFETIPAWTPLDHLAARLQSKTQRDFPVVGPDGTIVGLLTRDHLARGLDEVHPMTEVQGVMATHFPLLAETLPFAAAFEALIASRLPALPVVNASGVVIGLFTRDRVTELMTRSGPLPS